MNTTVLIRLLLLGMIWGASFLFQRIAVPVVGAGTTAGARMVFAALTMALVLVVLRKPLQWRRRWKDYVLIGTIVSTVPFLCFAFGAYVLPAGYLAVVNATTPMFTVLLAGMAGQQPSTSKWLGVVFGFFGVFTLARFGAIGLNLQSVAAFSAVLLAAFCYAFSARAIQKRFADADPLVVASGNLIGGTLPLLPFAVWSLPTQVPSLGVIGALVALGVVCTAFAYALHFQNIRDAGSERAVTVTLFVPIFAQLWGALFLGEHVTWASAIGSALVLFAVALIFEMLPGFKRKAPVVKLLPRECS
jgi:drug/metabolite transporter (DMT)-like permease